MLGILILVGIVAGFYNLAKKKDLNGALYAVLAIVFWFGGQFIAGLILGVMDPYALDDMGKLIIWGLGGSIGGIAILYFILMSAAKKKESAVIETSEEIMDDTSIDDL